MSYQVTILRHCQSLWNLENRFTGWTDVGLTPRGVDESRAAGRALVSARHDYDVVHTSLLKRAILTAWHVLEEMDRAWLPVHRTWRLNERHYGALQGDNKAETARRVGEEQCALWRRSYAARPPALEADDERHPRHAPMYGHLPTELLPTTESLEDVQRRLLPYWFDRIVPDIQAGRRVLVVAHGNSLRALLMHLGQMSPGEVCELEVPVGVPLVQELDDAWRSLRPGTIPLTESEGS